MIICKNFLGFEIERTLEDSSLCIQAAFRAFNLLSISIIDKPPSVISPIKDVSFDYFRFVPYKLKYESLDFIYLFFIW